MKNIENNKIMLDIQNVSMRFMMANDKVTSIKEMMTQMLKGKIHFKEFWALKKCEFPSEKRRSRWNYWTQWRR